MKFKYDYKEGQIYLIRFDNCYKVGYTTNLYKRSRRYEKRYEGQDIKLLWLEHFDYVFLALLAEHVLCRVLKPYVYPGAKRERICLKVSEVEIMQSMEVIADTVRLDFEDPRHLNWYKCMREANKRRTFNLVKESCAVILERHDPVHLIGTKSRKG